MRKSCIGLLFLSLLLACTLIAAGTATAQTKEKEAKPAKKAAESAPVDKGGVEKADVEEEEVEEEEGEAEVEEEEEEEEEEVEEEEEEEEEAEEDDAAVEEDDEEEAEEPAKPAKVKTPPEPLPEFPPVGVPLLEGKWIDLRFTAAVVTLYELDVSGLKSDPELAHDFDMLHAFMGFRGAFWDDRLELAVLGDMAEWINPNEFLWDSSFLLDAFVTVRPLKGMVADDLSGLEIRMGRFIPGFTHYQTRNEAMLDTIHAPALTTAMYPLRQMGLEAAFCHKYFEAALGVFNGMRFLPDALGTGSSIWLGPGYRGATLGNVPDDNKGKDVMVRLTGKVPFGLRIDGFFYMSRPEYNDAASATHAVAPAFLYGGEVLFENLLADQVKLKLVANFTGRTMTYPSVAGGGKIHPNVTQYGFLFHAGIRVGRWVEPMVRVDFWNGRASDFGSPSPGLVFYGQDPFGRVQTMASGATWEMWATGGLNAFLFGDHFRLTLTGTYVHRANEGLRDDFWLGIQAAAII